MRAGSLKTLPFLNHRATMRSAAVRRRSPLGVDVAALKNLAVSGREAALRSILSVVTDEAFRQRCGQMQKNVQDSLLAMPESGHAKTLIPALAVRIERGIDMVQTQAAPQNDQRLTDAAYLYLFCSRLEALLTASLYEVRYGAAQAYSPLAKAQMLAKQQTPGPHRKTKLEKKWDLSLESKPATPMVALKDGGFIVGESNGYYRAISASGQWTWHTAFSNGIGTIPVQDAAGRIYFSSRLGNLRCLNPQGEKLWEFQFRSNVSAAVAVTAEGNIVMAGHASPAVCLSPNRDVIWRSEHNIDCELQPVVHFNDDVSFLSSSGIVHRLSANGKLRPGFPRSVAHAKNLGWFKAAVLLAPDDGLVIPSVKCGLAHLSADGATLRHYAEKGAFLRSPTWKPNGTLVAALRSQLLQFEPHGPPRHPKHFCAEIIGDPICFGNGDVLVANTAGDLWRIDNLDRKVFHGSASGRLEHTPVIAADDSLALVTAEGRITAFVERPR